MHGLTARLAVMLATVLLAGCGTAAEQGPPESGPLETMVMGTGPVGGTYYPLGGAIAQMWSDEVDDLTVSTLATDASVDNLRALDAGDLQLGMAVSGVASHAAAGEGEFDGDALDFTLIGNLYPEVVQIAAAPGSGIETLADLDGRRVAVGPAGSGTRAMAEAIFRAAGVTPVETVEEDFGEAAVDLGEGAVDAAVGVLALPDMAIGETAKGADIELVPIPGDVRAALAAADPTLSETEIPAGTYTGVDASVTTLRTWAALYAMRDLDEDQVYRLTEALYEHGGSLDNSTAGAIDATTATEGRVGVDLHPGAARYYEEQVLH
ncbi:TAXI family TRAP transporter solute-binding subunit [Glycomyces arizonensis]|uniref:TAXI family TRAP transporter solute-binding subunit n=1 Tax=Glycomyces arizonensis TaxID=256035 RepID=UPI00040BEB50|nr:TAXI family TRAP transporter solute-binding subunit [Glycomyces arizonensis]